MYKVSRPSHRTGQRNRYVRNSPSTASVQVTDHNNLDDFFRQPSADELAAVEHLSSSSESRVSEIIADLQKQTSEELEWWSSCFSQSMSIENSKLMEPVAFASTTFTSPPSNDETKVQYDCCDSLLPGAGIVSSPISFLSPSFSSLKSLKASTSNIVPVIKSRISVRARRAVGHIASAAQLQSTPEQLDIQTTILQSDSRGERDREYRTIRHSSEVSPAKPSFQSFLKRVPKPASRSQPASTATVSAQNRLTKTVPRSKLSSNHDRFSFEPAERVQESAAVPEGSTIPKRKPLPKDSPLLIPLSRHPAFAKVSKFGGQVQKMGGNSRDVNPAYEAYDLDEELRLLNMLPPLPPTVASPS